ncbi:MAG: PEGA domain-containing protein [Candidatus Magasanikbacteria bacterium]
MRTNNKEKLQIKLWLLCSIFFLLIFYVPFVSGCNGSSPGNGGIDENDNGYQDVSIDSYSDVVADVGTDTSGDMNVNEDSSDGMTKKEFCQFCKEKGLDCPETMPDGAGSLSKEDCIDPNKPGTLKVTAETTAESPSVFIDGKDSGKDAPASIEKKPGKYRVALRADGYLMRVDLMDKKPEQVQVKPGKEKKVKIKLYRDGRGTWQSQEDPKKQPVVKMHTKSFEGVKCESEVWLKNLDDANSSYCLHTDGTFNLGSEENPGAAGSWYKGNFLNEKKIKFIPCAKVTDGCVEPEVFKKISDCSNSDC